MDDRLIWRFTFPVHYILGNEPILGAWKHHENFLKAQETVRRFEERRAALPLPPRNEIPSPYQVRHKTKVRNIPDRVSIHDRPSEAAISLLLPYRKNVHTITTDNGSEFRNHRRIADALNAKVYFADSYASWQKGAIENANKLIRQYIPKGTDFNMITDDFIHSVQLKINRRPREKLNFSTPKDEFFKFLS